MSDTLGTDATATSSGTVRVRIPPRPTTSSLIHVAAEIRDRADLIGNDAEEIHDTLRRRQLEDETALNAKRDPVDVLEDVALETGMAWSSIARMVGVSDTAVRKWRRGESVTPENRRRLARVCAFMQLLTKQYPIADPASWLEMPIVDEATVTGVDVFAANRYDLLFEYAAGRMAPTAILDAFDPEWRSRYAVDSRFRMEIAGDSEPAIVEREE